MEGKAEGSVTKNKHEYLCLVLAPAVPPASRALQERTCTNGTTSRSYAVQAPSVHGSCSHRLAGRRHG